MKHKGNMSITIRSAIAMLVICAIVVVVVYVKKISVKDADNKTETTTMNQEDREDVSGNAEAHDITIVTEELSSEEQAYNSLFREGYPRGEEAFNQFLLDMSEKDYAKYAVDMGTDFGPEIHYYDFIVDEFGARVTVSIERYFDENGKPQEVIDNFATTSFVYLFDNYVYFADSASKETCGLWYDSPKAYVNSYQFGFASNDMLEVAKEVEKRLIALAEDSVYIWSENGMRLGYNKDNLENQFSLLCEGKKSCFSPMLEDGSNPLENGVDTYVGMQWWPPLDDKETFYIIGKNDQS